MAILIAITGDVGAGKSSALSAVADGLRADGASCAGFVSEAEGRTEPGKGAGRYTLRNLISGETCVAAERGDDGKIAPVQGATEWAKAWLEGELSGKTVLLDELGKWEAEGGGLMPLARDVLARKPLAIVASVRKDALDSIQAQWGRPFDLVFEVGDAADVATHVVDAVRQAPDWRRVGWFGAGSGGLEMSVGAAMHALKFPLTGLAMSTAQAGIMTVAADGLHRKDRVAYAALISAGLKAMSPAGSRLGPMLAISMQGLLFTGSIRALGWNVLGAGVGGALVGAWAGSQGLLVQYLLLGNGLQRAYDTFVKWLAQRFDLAAPSLPLLAAGVIGLYALVAGSTTAWVWLRRHRVRARVERRLESGAVTVKKLRPGGWWRPLVSPTFLVPTLLVCGLLALSGARADEVGLVAVRAVGVGLVLGIAMVGLKPEVVLRWLRRTGRWGAAYALGSALDQATPGKNSVEP